MYDASRVEPTLDSLQAAADFALDADVDGFVSVGGGSSIDTAKVANLIVSHPAPVMDYVNAPVGDGPRRRGRCGRTSRSRRRAGTGSEATTVAVLDIPERRVKTGISHRYLRPSQAIVDPSLAAYAARRGRRVGRAGRHLPRGGVVPLAAVYGARAARVARRPPALPGREPGRRRLVCEGARVRRAVPAPRGRRGDDVEARGAMMLAASMAGVGFGSAGVHIPHACAYPIAGLKHAYAPPGYPADHPFVPHGISVIVTAPAAFRFTYPADPERHEQRRRCSGGGTGPTRSRTRCRR